MRIVHVIDRLDPKLGGPPAVAIQLAAAQAALGHDVTVVSHAQDAAAHRLPRAFSWVPRADDLNLLAVPIEHGLDKLRVPHARGVLDDTIGRADVTHLHGVWEPLLWTAAAVSRRHKIPYVVRPAGMLDPWSLSQKKLKKRLALAMGFRQMLNEAAFIHALNRDERDMVSLMGLRCPAVVIPNGVFMELLAKVPPRGTFRRRFPGLADSPYILFMSRMTSRSGLTQLADAFQMVARRDTDVRMVVAGADEGAREGFERRIARYGLLDRVVMAGPLFGREKLAAMNEAALFCLPSWQQSFSVVIAEAMAMGLPAVISHACHFPEVAEADAGRVVELDPRALSEAMVQLLQDPDLRARMSANATALARQEFDWPRVAERCIQLYALHGGASGTIPEPHLPATDGAPEISITPPKLRILHVVKNLDPAAGGPPVVAIKLAEAQSRQGHSVHVLAYRKLDAENDIRAFLNEVPNSKDLEIHYLPELNRSESLIGSKVAAVARSMIRRFDVVHLHGVWEPMLMRVAAEARKASVPYVITPHGMLDPWSLSQRRMKKQVALKLVGNTMLNSAAFLHVLNTDERDLLTPLGLTAPTEIVPNGVFPEEVENLPEKGTFRAKYPQLGQDPYILFLSRLHFKKGLDYLADSFALLAPRLPNVRLVVAGPDGGARADFEKQIAKAGLESRVLLTGPIYGKMKVEAIVDAAVFCLPSRQEGFSMVITEALGCGTACVVSHACHYPEVEEVGAGFCTDLNPQQIADALFKALSDPAMSAQMGAAGRELVRSRFTWPVIADRMVANYRKHMGAEAGAGSEAVRQ